MSKDNIDFEKLVVIVGEQNAFNQVIDYLDRNGLNIKEITEPVEPHPNQTSLVLSEN